MYPHRSLVLTTAQTLKPKQTQPRTNNKLHVPYMSPNCGKLPFAQRPAATRRRLAAGYPQHPLSLSARGSVAKIAMVSPTAILGNRRLAFGGTYNWGYIRIIVYPKG